MKNSSIIPKVPGKIDKESLAGDPRYPFGNPRTDIGTYLWIQHFHSALNKAGRTGFDTANSAADACASEQEIREIIVRAGYVDVMVAIGPNFETIGEDRAKSCRAAGGTVLAW